MTLWLMLLVIGALTYAIRLSCIGLLGQREMPALLLKALRFVPIAVLPAIILPQLFLRNNTLVLSLQNPRWIAGMLAGATAHEFNMAWLAADWITPVIAADGLAQAGVPTEKPHG